MSRRTKATLWGGGAFLATLLVGGWTLVPRIVAGRLNANLLVVGPTPSEAATRLHRTLTIADLHTDALLWDRRLTERSSTGHVDIPRLSEGRVAVQGFATVTKVPWGANLETNSAESDQITTLAVVQAWPFRTWGSLLERSLFQASKLRDAAARSGGALRIVESRGDLSKALSDRDGGTVTTAAFLGLEGAQALEADLSNVDLLYDAGFRMIGLTHFFDNELGGSAHGEEKPGLSDFGRAAVSRMEALGIAIDLAHASPDLIDDVLAIASRPLVVSHTGVRGTCDINRNLDDDGLAAIAETGGVVGIGLWTTVLCGDSPRHWAKAVRHAVSIAGVDHVGLGSDWDGAVQAIVDASGTVYLTDALLREGFRPDEIRRIMGENVIRVLEETLPGN